MQLNKPIKQLYNVDMLKIIYQVPKEKVAKLLSSLEYSFCNYSLIKCDDERKKINDYRFLKVWKSEHFIIASDYKMKDNPGYENILIRFENRALYTNNYINILKEIANEFKAIKLIEIKLDIAMDSDCNIYKLFDETLNNDQLYKYDNKTFINKELQENYTQILIGSKNNFWFKIYNKTKELLHSKKDYIKDIHLKTFGTDDIYRMELSLKNKHLKNVDVFNLNNKDYLKKLFKEYFEKRFKFRRINQNDKNRSRYEVEYLFDINGENCLSHPDIITEKAENIIDKPDNISEYKSENINKYKSIITMLHQEYQKNKQQCYFDTIVQIAVNYNLISHIEKLNHTKLIEAAMNTQIEKFSGLDLFDFCKT